MLSLCIFFRYNTKSKDISKKVSNIVRKSTRESNRPSRFADSAKDEQIGRSSSQHKPENSETVNLLLNEKIVTISKCLFIYLCK